MIEERTPADSAGVVQAPLTVRQALELATRRLTHVGIERGALDASLLLAEACGTDRLGIYTDPDRSLSASQCRAFQDLLERRARREPVAYILGRREFYGLDFGVTSDVLIPRPETELLVERAIAWIKARAPAHPQPLLADIGTGSGAIAATVAHICRVGRWIATDVSAAALEVARANAARHGVADRIDFRQGHLLEPIGETLDGLCSNAPYVAERDRDSLEPEITVWEPPEALFSGPDGLDHIRELIACAPARLRLGGLFLTECGQGQAESILRLLAEDGRYSPGRVHHDDAGIGRVIEAECTQASRRRRGSLPPS